MLGNADLRTYLKYIIPSILSFVIVGTYSVVDGIFVGQKIGDLGLASVNIAFPLIALLEAVGMGIGMGGGVISSIRKGEGDNEASRKVSSHTISLLFIASVILFAVLILLKRPLLGLIGGVGDTLDGADLYLSWICIGVVAQVMVSGFIPLARNENGVTFSFVVTAFCLGANIFLDWLFIFVYDGGLAGAALATAIAQIMGFICFIVFFFKPERRPRIHDMKPEAALTIATVKGGFAPFSLTLLPEINTVAMNIRAVQLGGEGAVAAWAVMAYVGCVVQFVIQGVGDGSQPLMSRFYGARDVMTVRRIRRMNYTLTITFGIVGIVALFFLRQAVADAYGVSKTTETLFLEGFPLFCFVFPFFGISHVSTSSFYSTRSNRSSTILVISEAVFIVIAVIVAPIYLGLNGLWLAPVFTQILLSAMAVFLLAMNRSVLETHAKKSD